MNGAGVVADQSAAVAEVVGACAVSGSIGIGDGAGVLPDQPATVTAVTTVAGGVGVVDATVVGISKGAVEDADVDNGCGAVYSVEQGWIGLRRAEGDSMIITVEGAAEVSDGDPVRVYSDILCQAIIPVGIGGEVIAQVCSRCDVLAIGRIWVVCIGYCATGGSVIRI